MPAATWTDRVWREFHADNLTRAYRDVLLTLRSYRGAGGLICPSHTTVAERVGCSVRTVQRALAMAAELGLVAWSERRVRAAWRWLRTSNRYWLLTPEMPAEPGLRAPRRPWVPTTGHLDQGGKSKENKAALRDMLTAAAGLPDLLAMRRAAIEGGVSSR